MLDTVLVVRDPGGRVLTESEAIHGGYVTDAEIRDLESKLKARDHTIESVRSSEGSAPMVSSTGTMR